MGGGHVEGGAREGHVKRARPAEARDERVAARHVARHAAHHRSLRAAPPTTAATRAGCIQVPGVADSVGLIEYMCSAFMEGLRSQVRPRHATRGRAAHHRATCGRVAGALPRFSCSRTDCTTISTPLRQKYKLFAEMQEQYNRLANEVKALRAENEELRSRGVSNGHAGNARS